MGMGRATGSVESDARTDFFLDRASGGVHRLAGELLFGEAERLHANTNGRVLSVILVTFDVRIDTSHQASGNWRNIAIALIMVKTCKAWLRKLSPTPHSYSRFPFTADCCRLADIGVSQISRT